MRFLYKSFSNLAAIFCIGIVILQLSCGKHDKDEKGVPVNDLIPRIMKKAKLMFFYTAGKQEVRSWVVNEGDDAVTCAGKIHTDLARGFIKAEIIHIDELLKCHNFQDARSKGLTKLVDRDFKIAEKTVLEIRFNV